MGVTAQRLTAEAFAPFGQVLMARGQGAQRDEFAARLDNRRPEARPNLTLIRTAPPEAVAVIRVLERHPYSSQTFVPLDGSRYVVGVCPSAANGEPELPRLAVFFADGGQTINYDAGVWHTPNQTLGRAGEFVMLRWDTGSPEDTEVRTLDVAVEVDVTVV